ncbi:glycerol kinase [Brevibacillus ruminantium]|uniref:Glycerol kinase n=1 Tax=Brevibacillus ruminantium TaxID=2950604 RepID=A0ABY4WFL5_9BACL|nr:glycerol kinase [Brevibacillus ruminantium]USG64802.1 glycerol kinase [Brevibacillus ruminantium]
MGNQQKYLSTTSLSKLINVPTSELFSDLTNLGWIERKNDTWALTQIGIEKGGQLRSDSLRGTWIAWPESLREEIENMKTSEKKQTTYINATSLSQIFNVSKLRINPILSELGWVEKDRKGWILTKLGKSIGGKQLEYDKTGIPYVTWPESIVNNKRLVETIRQVQGEGTDEKVSGTEFSFREKFEAKHRSADGHFVRSKAEMLIDNWLYMSEIVHAYERKLPIEEDVYCDFYLPVGKVYIEYWGIENDPKYLERKKSKLEIYRKYSFNLIELTESDIQNLDDIFPKKLLKFGIQAF